MHIIEMVIVFAILLGSSGLVILYVFSLRKAERKLTIWCSKITQFVMHLFLVFGMYGAPVIVLVVYYLSEPENRLQADTDIIGTAWLMFLGGLFCLRHFLGYILSREGTIGVTV